MRAKSSIERGEVLSAHCFEWWLHSACSLFSLTLKFKFVWNSIGCMLCLLSIHFYSPDKSIETYCRHYYYIVVSRDRALIFQICIPCDLNFKCTGGHLIIGRTQLSDVASFRALQTRICEIFWIQCRQQHEKLKPHRKNCQITTNDKHFTVL